MRPSIAALVILISTSAATGSPRAAASCQTAVHTVESLLVKQQAGIHAYAKVLDENHAKTKAAIDALELALKADKDVALAHLRVLKAQEKAEGDEANYKKAHAAIQDQIQRAQAVVDKICQRAR